MPERLEIKINDRPVTVDPGCTVAAAILIAGQPCHTSIAGQPRGPLCGMGTCFECRATVNGIPHTRTCQLLCEPAMQVRTT